MELSSINTVCFRFSLGDDPCWTSRKNSLELMISDFIFIFLGVLASLRELIKNTSILSDPSKFPEQALIAARLLASQTTHDSLPR